MSEIIDKEMVSVNCSTEFVLVPKIKQESISVIENYQEIHSVSVYKEHIYKEH